MNDRISNIELLCMLSQDLQSEGDHLTQEINSRGAAHARRVIELIGMLHKALSLLERENRCLTLAVALPSVGLSEVTAMASRGVKWNTKCWSRPWSTHSFAMPPIGDCRQMSCFRNLLPKAWSSPRASTSIPAAAISPLSTWPRTCSTTSAPEPAINRKERTCVLNC